MSEDRTARKKIESLERRVTRAEEAVDRLYNEADWLNHWREKKDAPAGCSSCEECLDGCEPEIDNFKPTVCNVCNQYIYKCNCKKDAPAVECEHVYHKGFSCCYRCGEPKPNTEPMKESANKAEKAECKLIGVTTTTGDRWCTTCNTWHKVKSWNKVNPQPATPLAEEQTLEDACQQLVIYFSMCSGGEKYEEIIKSAQMVIDYVRSHSSKDKDEKPRGWRPMAKDKILIDRKVAEEWMDSGVQADGKDVALWNALRKALGAERGRNE